MPIWNIITLQNRNSPTIEHLNIFHDHTITILVIITIITLYLITVSTLNYRFNRHLLENNQIELFWTILPTLILIFIAIPSIKTLYLIEEIISPSITIKTIGHQWHWTYDYSDFKNIKIRALNIKRNKIRLIKTFNRLVIPSNTPTRILITSKDVIHSWTIPSLGVKIDAVPGRINQSIILIKRPRVIIGQCSEVCGAGHRFIPIYLERPSIKLFLKKI